MTPNDVIAGLFAVGITLRAVDGELRFSGPPGTYGAAARALVAAHRDAIAAALAADGAAAPWLAVLREVATWPADIQQLLARRASEVEAGDGLTRAAAEARAFGELREAARAPVVSVALYADRGVTAVAFAAVCGSTIGRPGPASAADDALVAGVILRQYPARPMKPAMGAGEAAS